MDAESLRELAASIGVSGVLEPLVVRRDPETPDGYLLIAGHRRLAAAQLVASGDDIAARGHVMTLPCLVRDLDDDAAYALSLVENLQRKDLSARTPGRRPAPAPGLRLAQGAHRARDRAQ